jgi:hypothetical protein
MASGGDDLVGEATLRQMVPPLVRTKRNPWTALVPAASD